MELTGVYLIAEVNVEDTESAQAEIEAVRAVGGHAVRFDILVPEAAYTRVALERPTLCADGQTIQFGEVLRRQGLSSEILSEIREYARGRVDFILSVHDPQALMRALSMKPDGLLLPATAVFDSCLVAQVRDSGLRTFLDVTLTFPEECTNIARLFEEQSVALLLNARATGAYDLRQVVTGLSALSRFNLPLGLLGLESDVDLAVAGMAAGAVVMETGSPSFKKLAAAAKGFHHESRSLTPPIGPPERWDTLDAERASLVAARNIYAGEILSPEMIAAKAPYRGLSPRLLDYAVGLRALYDILEDEPLTFGNISA